MKLLISSGIISAKKGWTPAVVVPEGYFNQEMFRWANSSYAGKDTDNFVDD